MIGSMMKTVLGIGTLLVSMTSTMVLAEESDRSKFGIGIMGGTTGGGVMLSAGLTDSFKLRAGYSLFEYDADFDDDDVNYEAEFDKNSFAILADWHPGGADASFRLTAGAFVHSDNSVEVRALPTVTGTYTINGNVYNASDIGTVAGGVSFKKTTPYFGVGWGNTTRSRGFTFMMDLGVQFQNSPDVALTSLNCNLGAALCSQLAADLQAEVVELEQDGEDFDIWPVVNVGFIYRF